MMNDQKYITRSKRRCLIIVILMVSLGLGYVMAGVSTAQHGSPQIPEGAELGYDDGEVDSQCSLGDWGHAVFFSNEGKQNIYGIKICGARFDDASRRFDVEIWDNNLKTLYSAPYAYTDFFPDTYSPLDDSDLKWVTIDVPNIEVNGNFYITIFTYSGPPSWDKVAHDPHAPKGGIAIGRDSDTKSGNSFIVDKNPNTIVDWETITTWDIRQEDTDWMIRVVCPDASPAPHGVPYACCPWRWEMTYAPELENPVVYVTNNLCSFTISFVGPSSMSTTVMQGETKSLVLSPGLYNWEANKLPDQPCILSSSGSAWLDDQYQYHLIADDDCKSKPDEDDSSLSTDFSIEPSQNIDLGDFVTFDASSSTGDIVSYKWDFGDGIKNDGIVDFDGTEVDLSFNNKQVRHLFRSTGTFSVTLTIRDSNGNLDSITKAVNVDAKYEGAVLNISEVYEVYEQSYLYHAVYIKYAPVKIKVEKYSNTVGLSGIEVGSAVKHDAKEFFDFNFFAEMVAEKALFEGAKVVGYRINPIVGSVLTLKSFIGFVEFIQGYNFFVAGETNSDGEFAIHIPYETAESGDMGPNNLQFQEKTPEQLIYVSKSDIGLSEDTDQKFAYMKKINPSALPDDITFYYEPLKKEEKTMSSLPKLKITVKREIYRHSPVLQPKHLKDVPLIGVPIRIDGTDIGSTSAGGVLKVTEADLDDFGISPFGSHSLEAGDGTFYSRKTIQFDFTNERTTYVDIVLDKCKLPDTPSYATIINETPSNYPDLVIYPHAKSIENFINNKGILAEDLHVYMDDRTTKSIISGSDWVVVLCHFENIDKDYKLYSPGGYLFSVDTSSKKPLKSGSRWQIIRYDNKSVNTGDILQHIYYIVYDEENTEILETAVKEFFEIMEQELGPSGTPVESSSGEGTVYFDTGTATIENLIAVNVDDIPEVLPSDVNLPYDLFRFDIADLPIGESVTLTLTFPDSLSEGTAYWKYGKTQDNTVDHWYEIPVGDDDGDNIITIALTDGGLGDDDLTANGVIVDDGGPGIMEATSALTSGFGAVFAIAVILAVAHLLKRER